MLKLHFIKTILYYVAINSPDETEPFSPQRRFISPHIDWVFYFIVFKNNFVLTSLEKP